MIADERGRVSEMRVKQPEQPGSNWVWGAFKMPGDILAELHDLWRQRGERDEYIGTLVNAWIARGGKAGACARAAHILTWARWTDTWKRRGC